MRKVLFVVAIYTLIVNQCYKNTQADRHHEQGEESIVDSRIMSAGSYRPELSQGNSYMHTGFDLNNYTESLANTEQIDVIKKEVAPSSPLFLK